MFPGGGGLTENRRINNYQKLSCMFWPSFAQCQPPFVQGAVVRDGHGGKAEDMTADKGRLAVGWEGEKEARKAKEKGRKN